MDFRADFVEQRNQLLSGVNTRRFVSTRPIGSHFQDIRILGHHGFDPRELGRRTSS
jgi:hypothetical protein